MIARLYITKHWKESFDEEHIRRRGGRRIPDAHVG